MTQNTALDTDSNPNPNSNRDPAPTHTNFIRDNQGVFYFVGRLQ